MMRVYLEHFERAVVSCFLYSCPDGILLLASRRQNATIARREGLAHPMFQEAKHPVAIVPNEAQHLPYALTLTGEAPSLGGYLEKIPSMSWLALVDENEAASHTTTVRAGASVACRVSRCVFGRKDKARQTSERKEKERRHVKPVS